MYSNIFNTYLEIPDYKIDIDKCERIILERLKFLHLLNHHADHSGLKRHTPGYYHRLTTSQLITSAEFPTYYNMLIEDQMSLSDDAKFEARKTDHIAHYMLLLAFASSTSDHKQWLLNFESDLARFKIYTMRNSKCVVDELEIPYLTPTDAELAEIGKYIEVSDPNPSHFHRNDKSIRKFYFVDAIELLKYRTAFVRDGYVYASASQLGSVIVQRFRKNLEESMKAMSAAIGRVSAEDERILRLSKATSRSHQMLSIGITQVAYSSHTAVSRLTTMEPGRFPLCMKQLYQSLQHQHYLKYHGRLRLELFLKGLGLTLTESIQFWKESLQVGRENRTTDEKFQKVFRYSLGHLYGQEGTRKSRTPYNCGKIIGDRGCPFQDKANMSDSLCTDGIVPIEDLGPLLNEQNAQARCAKYFGIVNGREYNSATVGHPNDYYAQSFQPTAFTAVPTDEMPAPPPPAERRVVIFNQTVSSKNEPAPEQQHQQQEEIADFSGLAYL